MPLAGIDNAFGRIKFKRLKYSIVNQETRIFTAIVDGIALGQSGPRADWNRTIGFFEVKKDLQRSNDAEARRQVCSEMAAIIHNDDNKASNSPPIRLPYLSCKDGKRHP